MRRSPIHAREALTLPPLPLLRTEDVEDAFTKWRKGGSTDEACADRRARAPVVKARLHGLVARLRTGTHRFLMPRIGVTPEGREVALLEDMDRIAVGALVITFARHEQLKNLLPVSYAYLPPKRGSARLVRALVGTLKAIAKVDGAATFCGADLVQCYPSLSAVRALDRARAWGFGRWRCDALQYLYGFWNREPIFRGLTTGPACSPPLCDIALRPLDDLLLKLGPTYRFSDNTHTAMPGRVTSAVWCRMFSGALNTFNAIEGLSVSAHHFKTSVFDAQHGFVTPVRVLGFELEGMEIRPADSATVGCETKLQVAFRERDRTNEFSSGFAQLVHPEPLNPLVGGLTSDFFLPDVPIKLEATSTNFVFGAVRRADFDDVRSADLGAVRGRGHPMT